MQCTRVGWEGGVRIQSTGGAPQNHPKKDMPATRSQADAGVGGAEPEVADEPSRWKFSDEWKLAPEVFRLVEQQIHRR